MQAIQGTHFRNLSSAGTNVATQTIGAGMLIYNNNSGATAFLQFFDAPVASVVIGTTVPLFTVTVATSAYDWLEFSPPLLFSTACSVFATTTPEGSVSSAAGVFLQVFVN